MCGRYFIEGAFSEELKQITGYEFRQEENTREVFPTECVPIIYVKHDHYTVMEASWGYAHWEKKKNVLINARAESVQDKRLFRQSVKYRRCVIPVSGYYEWDAMKVRHRFTEAEAKMMLLAGIYQRTEAGYQFVILTTEASDGVRRVHERMPLVLNRDEMNMWLTGSEAWKLILRKRPLGVQCAEDDQKKYESGSYKQLTLF